MALVWLPGIWIDGTSTWYPLPRPVQDCTDDQGMDYTQHKIPHAGGAVMTGISRAVVQLSVRGLISKTGAGVVIGSETAMHTERDALVTALQGGTDGTFWFCTHYDSGSSTYRFWKDCVCTGRVLGEQQSYVAMPYSLRIVAADPVLYAAAAGNLT